MVRKSDSPQAYIIVNLLLAGVVLLIIGYSFLFSPEKNNYPVVCIHEKITGQKCPSCGMSHAFSLIVRGRIREAEQWNMYAMRTFLFFTIQFFMRIGLSLWLCRRKSFPAMVGYLDGLVSLIMVLITFYPLLSVQWKMLMA